MPHLIFFDGECGLCHRLVRYVLKWDKAEIFLFAPLQGKTAAAELTGRRAKLKNENTMVLLENYGAPNARLWIRGRAVFRILWLIGGSWRLLGWLCFAPCGVDLIYRFIARHRHRLGLPKPSALPKTSRQRFLP